MAATKLDGAGAQKMKTLEEALVQVQSLYALVERMALAAKQHQNTNIIGAQIRRAGAPLVGQLKGQFGPVSDQIAGMLLVATRGGGEQLKIRALREGVASVRTQIEILMNKVKEQHSVPIDSDSMR